VLKLEPIVKFAWVFSQDKGNYKLSNLVLEYNHTLQLPQTLHMFVSQRKISDLQGFEIKIADDAGIRPKQAHELDSIQVGGSLNLSYILVTTRTIYGASDNETWDMVKKEVCLYIFKKK
jgi:hypothetical protein